MKSLTDVQLISSYLEGNREAFNGLINRYSQSLYKFTYYLVNNKEEAHDIVQESFIKVWKNIKKFDQTKSFKTWIFTITERTAIDFLRKRKNISFSSMDNDESENNFAQSVPDKEPMQDEIFERNENIELVNEVLNMIPIDLKVIMILRHGEEMTFEEIAKVVDKPVNTVKSQYRRTLFTLKEHINSRMHRNSQ